jgi:hypothetical protein
MVVHVDVLLAGVQLERVGVRAGFLVDANIVMVPFHDPLHVARLGLAVPVQETIFQVPCQSLASWAASPLPMAPQPARQQLQKTSTETKTAGREKPTNLAMVDNLPLGISARWLGTTLFLFALDADSTGLPGGPEVTYAVGEADAGESGLRDRGEWEPEEAAAAADALGSCSGPAGSLSFYKSDHIPRSQTYAVYLACQNFPS